jgi:peptide/nickel transport system permease protein
LPSRRNLALAEHREVHAGHRSERLADRLARHLALEPFEGIAQGGEGLEGVDAHLLVRGVEPDLFSKHPLGTNNLSLDLLARSRHGARVSLLTSFLAVAIGLLVGGSIGLAAGFQRGRFDRVVGVFTDATLAFPGLILLIALAAMLGTPTTATEAVLKSGVALAIVGLPIMIRLARSQTLTFAQRAFVLAGRALGATKRRIMFAELAPNIALPLLSYALVLTAVLIVAEGSLAFLGLGLAQPQPTWGNMIAEGGLTTLTDYPHIPLVPGAFMFLTVLSLNRVGEWATARWGQRESQLWAGADGRRRVAEGRPTPERAIPDQRQNESPVVLIAATAELAGLTVLQVHKDFELIASITGKSTKRLRT